MVGSTTRHLSVLQSELFVGQTGPRTLFYIHTNTAVDIQAYSAFASEQELVLPPGCEFVVQSSAAFGGGLDWTTSAGEDRYRRGLYTFWKRSLTFPSLSAFDTPTGDSSCPRRTRSNTPLQALTTLNEKAFVEAAQAMALRVLKEGGKDERARAIYAFRLVTGRAPSAMELQKVLKFMLTELCRSWSLEPTTWAISQRWVVWIGI